MEVLEDANTYNYYFTNKKKITDEIEKVDDNKSEEMSIGKNCRLKAESQKGYYCLLFVEFSIKIGSTKQIMSENLDDSQKNNFFKIFEIIFIPQKIKEENYEKLGMILLIKEITNAKCVQIIQNNNHINKRIISSISHELRTPLNCAMNMFEILSEILIDEPEMMNNYIHPGNDSLKLLLNFINDLFDYVNIENDKIQINYFDFDLGNLIQDIKSLFERQASIRNLKFEIEIDKNINLTICSDPNRIRQIIINLLMSKFLENTVYLGNAIKYTIEGEILIKVKKVKENLMKISVEDTGFGINSGQIQNLGLINFYYIGRMSFNDKNKIVSGMGLTVSNRLAEYLGPKSEKNGIYVSTKIGVGSKFSFLILNQNTLIGKEKIENEDFDSSIINEANNDSLFDTMQKFKETDIADIKFLEKNQMIKVEKNSPGITVSEGMESLENNIISLENASFLSLKKTMKSNKNLTENFGINLIKNNRSKFSESKSINIPTDTLFLKRNPKRNSMNYKIKSTEAYLSYTKQLSNLNIKGNDIKNKEKYLENLVNKNKAKACLCPDILIVDDTDFNLLVLKTLCEKFLFRVKTASSGNEAILHVKEMFEESICCKTFKLILMDIDMPIKNGYETTKELKDYFSKSKFETPIVACSAFTGDEEIKKAFEVGMLDYICKPVNASGLTLIFVNYIEIINEN